jgi:uncharacterized membrane protein YhaH (DUF805 family)
MSSFGNPFTFKGRITRRTFWLRYGLGCGVAAGVAAALDDAVFGHPLLTPLAGLVMTVLSLAGQVRRLHDRGRSGWWLLIAATGIGAIWLFVECGFLRGTVGSNRFGADPLNGLDGTALPAAA